LFLQVLAQPVNPIGQFSGTVSYWWSQTPQGVVQTKLGKMQANKVEDAFREKRVLGKKPKL